MEKRLVKIGEAAQLLGVSISTLRKWEDTGELIPARKTAGGTRFYATADLLGLGDADAPTVCYARVSSHDQKLEIITVFSARLYGSRSKKNKELLEALKKAAEK